MPNAYHHVFFTVRDGIAEAEVIERFRRYRDVVVGKGYIQSADDLSLGKGVIPVGGDDEVAGARQMWRGLGGVSCMQGRRLGQGGRATRGGGAKAERCTRVAPKTLFVRLPAHR